MLPVQPRVARNGCEDTVSPESEIQRIRELIRRNEQTLGSGPLSGTEQPAPSAFREKETTDGEEEKPGKTEPEDTVPEETPRSRNISEFTPDYKNTQDFLETCDRLFKYLKGKNAISNDTVPGTVRTVRESFPSYGSSNSMLLFLHKSRLIILCF